MINRKLVKLLSYRYLILSAILLLFAAGLLFLPNYQKHEGIDPSAALAAAISPERYISVDELAHAIIVEDPSLLIIDVRAKERYETYSIPGATHVPREDILGDEYIGFFDQEAYEVVIYSDDNFYADQAWMIGNRLGFRNLRVLKGGMHSWYANIIDPKKPEEQMPSTEHELYAFRKAASMYFGVAYPDEITEVIEAPKPKPKPKPKTVAPVKKKKKRMPEGGC